MRKKYLLRFLALPTVFGLMTACAAPAETMSEALREICGHSFKGKVISQDPQDADWRAEILIEGPVKCDVPGQIEMPLAVGANESRTWFVTGRGETLELRHQHLLGDGSLDPVTNYGGVVKAEPSLKGQTWRAEFPADDITVDVFKANGLDVSITNVWALEITPGETLKYELTRENRDFRTVFDLSNPL